jgi:cation diffusion facilitator CzcD-associated flavoprotein CzcO
MNSTEEALKQALPLSNHENATDVLVIGAGPAGLAVSACLRDHGVAHQLVERDRDVASTWRRHYTRLHLHTIKGYSALPGMSWPKGTPQYPSREQVVEYLTRYASERAVAPQFGVEVKRITRSGDRFAVTTNGGTLTPRFIVVATGYNGVPAQPQFSGLDTFAGVVVHSRDYRDAAPFAGKRTLVVGCGNSGAEIALDLAEQNVSVSMVVRGPVHVVPRDLLGRPSQKTSVLLSHLPIALRDALIGPVLKLAVGDLTAWGIVRPSVGVQRLIHEHGRIPILDVGTIAMVKAGRIAVVPGVARIDQQTVHFADGSTRDFDAIVLATGYSPGLERIVDGFDAIADERGRPHRFGEETDIPGLYFVGFRNPSTGALREISLEAPRVAAQLARASQGAARA